MVPIKIHNVGTYLHAQILMLLTSVRGKKTAKLIRTFIRQFLKVNSIGQIIIHND